MMDSKKHLIYDFTLAELAAVLDEWGQPPYRAQQIWHGLYRQLWAAPDQFTNIPKDLRENLSAYFSFHHLTPSQALISEDRQTRKTLFELEDGNAIEAVIMNYSRRRTLCISTQAGCAMGCSFCATGQMGFRRHLSSGEIVEQVLFYARQLKSRDKKVSNIVIMGMGEPFHNYDATMKAIDTINQKQGFNLGARRITVSTVGIVPAIRKFAAEKRQVNLAISLHAADDNLRSQLLPINRKYPLSEVIEACRTYTVQTHRRISFEWALIHRVNDTPAQAEKLAALLQGLLCHVNLIPLNPTRKFKGEASGYRRIQSFQAVLEERGIPCTIRLRRGIEIQAGCGQLASHSPASNPV